MCKKQDLTLAGMLLAALMPSLGAAQTTPANQTLTAVRGIRVGHHTLTERPTGCTVVLTGNGAVAGVDVRGAAPGTRETDALNPVNVVQEVHGIVLAGGSAFGLDAATGVMRYLDERGIGFKARSVNIPIVSAAVLIDLFIGNPKVRPAADCGYRAAQEATSDPVAEGNVGAGAGATVGKIAGLDRAMKGGIGSAAIVMPDGLIVSAVVAVNALGDVIDPASGRVVAGVRTADGAGLADARALLRSGAPLRAFSGENSTIGIVATNATLTKTQATKIAQMAHDGYARAIAPIHTLADGDTIFTLATGSHAGSADVSRIGALAAEVVAEAVVRAVRKAVSIPGYPGLADWSPSR
jgi:L-aminopeptidase/D-esterase-like protein